MLRSIALIVVVLIGCSRPPAPNLSVQFSGDWSRLTVAGVPVDLARDCGLPPLPRRELFIEFFEYGNPTPEPAGVIYADGEVVAVVLLGTLELSCIATASTAAT